MCIKKNSLNKLSLAADPLKRKAECKKCLTYTDADDDACNDGNKEPNHTEVKVGYVVDH